MADVPTAPDGEVRFYAKHQPAWDKYDSSQASFDFYNLHYDRMQVYSGYWVGTFDDRYSRGWVYKDSYALKPGWAITSQHPEWILRDSSNNRLYIPWGCSDGTCPQYAADFGNPAFRSWWIGELSAVFAANTYAGVWVDDVNMDFRVGNGSGAHVTPIDPRTGTTMTLADWRRYMAEFMEQIRAAFPTKEIAHNGIWFSDNSRTDLFIRRQILAGDYFNLERGFSDGGIVAGTGRYGISTYMAFVDYVHSLNRAVVQMEYTGSTTLREYGLAGYLLTNTGRDFISSDEEFWVAPGYWWTGWETNLGNAKSARYSIPGGWRREFTCGYAEMMGPPVKTGVVVQRACDSGTCH
jgi:hypothetical protein